MVVGRVDLPAFKRIVFMKKLLILGQIPKEYGGNYTTGVANVIMELSSHMSNHLAVYLYGTNLRAVVKSPIDNINFLGYSKKLLLRLLMFHLLTRPLGVIRECRNYRKIYGVPPIKFLAYRVMIQEYIRKIKPDYINAHGMIFSPVINQLKLEKEVIFSFHGFMHDDPASVLANRHRGIDMEKLYINGARAVHNSVYLTPDMRKKGIEQLKIKEHHSCIIPNGVSTDKFHFAPEQRQELREKLNIAEDALVFISVGALTRRKNHKSFIEFLERNKINAYYWIIGKAVGQEKETRTELHQTAENASNVEVKIIDYVPHDALFKYYSAADIYAHPSSSEGQALVALEAMCCGLPLIVNNQIKETLGLDVSFDKYVYLVDLNEGKMPEISTPNRDLLSTKCREQLSWEASAKKYLELFQN